MMLTIVQLTGGMSADKWLKELNCFVDEDENGSGAGHSWAIIAQQPGSYRERASHHVVQLRDNRRAKIIHIGDN